MGNTYFSYLAHRLRLVSPSIRPPSLKMADRIEGLSTKHAKKSEHLFMEFHKYCSCAIVSNLPNNESDRPFSKYSVKHGRHAALCIVPQHTEALTH